MKYLSKYINRAKLDMTYKMHVRPQLEYGDIIFHNSSQDLMALIESIQYQAGLIVTGCWKGKNYLKNLAGRLYPTDKIFIVCLRITKLNQKLRPNI